MSRAGHASRACWPSLLVAASLGACSSFDFFAKKDDTPPDEPADRLYNEGLYLLNAKKDARDAVKKFEEVDRQHPYSEWARKSLLMTSYAYYQAGEYDDCVNAAKRYVTLHPGSADAAYAQYLIASSYFEEIPDVTRDQARTEKALAALEEVIRKYPTTEYANSSKQKIEVARDQLAGKEMEIGRYYLKKKDYTGAINRFKVVVTKYQTTRHVEEALMRLDGKSIWRSASSTRRRPRPPCSGTISRTASGTSTLMHVVKTGGVEPKENTGSWISKAFKGIGWASARGRLDSQRKGRPKDKPCAGLPRL